MDEIKALALVCTLTRSPDPSSSDLIARQVLDELAKHDVVGRVIRVVDHNVEPGVSRRMSEKDGWPEILREVLAADIILISTPIWLGHMSSVAQRVLERLDAELSETRLDGSPTMFGKIGITAVVGNEDGAHKVTADLMQALNDVGVTVPAQGGTYWTGEAMQTTDYRELEKTPEKVASANAVVAANAAHLARLLRATPFSPPE
ncbi:MAG: NAD(P)H-dependent oxidoreductase [Nocardiaceae bacterium]|nr:NAD(P)H-dependent oxidoreductase [Nocardiaceae bacterium]